MIYKFPEITEFFNKPEFTGGELDDFYSSIEKKYLIPEELKAAKFLISLQLKKYEIQSSLIRPKKSNQQLRPISSKEKLLERKILNKLSSKTVLKISKALILKPIDFLEELKSRNIQKNFFDILTPEEFAGISDFILSNLKNKSKILNPLLPKKHKSKKRKKEDEANSYSLFQPSSTKAYNKLETFGGPGKIIYIRASK